MKMKNLTLIIIIAIIFIACTKKEDNTLQDNTNSNNLRNKLSKVNEHKKQTSNHKTSNLNLKKIESYTNFKEKFENYEIFSKDDLLSDAEINKLSFDEKTNYIDMLVNRTVDSAEGIVLPIYEQMKETKLLDLCDPNQLKHLILMTSVCLNNQGDGFEKIFKLFDEYLEKYPENTDGDFWSFYNNYLLNSQDYKKAKELYNKYSENMDLYSKAQLLNVGRFNEPFEEYQADLINLIKTTSNDHYKEFLYEWLAERIAREKLYPNYSRASKNIDIAFLYRYGDIGGHIFNFDPNRTINSDENLAEKMFDNRRSMEIMEARKNLEPEYIAEYDRYILEYSKALSDLKKEIQALIFWMVPESSQFYKLISPIFHH